MYTWWGTFHSPISGDEEDKEAEKHDDVADGQLEPLVLLLVAEPEAGINQKLTPLTNG